MSDKEEKCIFCYAEMPCEHDDILSERVEEADIIVEESGDDDSRRGPGRPQKDIGDFEDPVSSGRKRAAVLAPIEPGLVCEWAYLRNAGGGPKPIKGCAGNPASDRHHGPDKSTFNNELGINLHRICDHCHNRWHSANDEFYGERPVDNSEYVPIVEWSPHDPTEKMTVTEAHLEEIKRQ